MNILDQKNNTGFTLIETLVAVSIFTVSVIALITVLANSISDTNYAKRKLDATYLAQEGIEYARNMRDTYLLYPPAATVGWDDFKVKLSPCDTATSGSCYFDEQALNFTDQSQPIIDVSVNACPLSVCPNLLYNSVTGKYNYSTGVDSGFQRKLYITNINNNEIQIVSTVSFLENNNTYEVKLSENLFNWIRP